MCLPKCTGGIKKKTIPFHKEIRYNTKTDNEFGKKCSSYSFNRQKRRACRGSQTPTGSFGHVLRFTVFPQRLIVSARVDTVLHRKNILSRGMTMKSDIIMVTNEGTGIRESIEQAVSSAAYRGLNNKETLRLRLLSEEMLGMLREIAGKTEARFWVESEGKKFQLHMLACPQITEPMRKELLSVSSSGKNAAAVGVMGKLRDIFERAFDASEIGDQNSYYMQGLLLSASAEGIDPLVYSANANMVTWSMQKFKSTVKEEKETSEEALEEWDELEKSIIANLADEVRIAIRGNKVEMTVYKDFGGK